MDPTPALATPIQRPNPPPDHTENAANSCTTPMTRVIQPQVLRSLMMNFVFATKKFALSIAAPPQRQSGTPRIRIMPPGKSPHPAPSVLPLRPQLLPFFLEWVDPPPPRPCRQRGRPC